MATSTQRIDVRSEALRTLREGGDLDDLRQLIAREQMRSRRTDAHLDELLALLVDVYELSGANREKSIQMHGLRMSRVSWNLGDDPG